MLCLVTKCLAAEPTFYSIWPKESQNDIGEDGSSNEAITSALQADLNGDATQLYTSQSPSLDFT